MDQITITLQDQATRSFVKKLVAKGVYPSASEYVLALIKEHRNRRAKERLEQLLLEGLEGEERELTDEDWEDMRRRLVSSFIVVDRKGG